LPARKRRKLEPAAIKHLPEQIATEQPVHGIDKKEEKEEEMILFYESDDFLNLFKSHHFSQNLKSKV
jgi:hypothetical protein